MTGNIQWYVSLHLWWNNWSKECQLCNKKKKENPAMQLVKTLSIHLPCWASTVRYLNYGPVHRQTPSVVMCFIPSVNNTNKVENNMLRNYWCTTMSKSGKGQTQIMCWCLTENKGCWLLSLKHSYHWKCAIPSEKRIVQAINFFYHKHIEITFVMFWEHTIKPYCFIHNVFCDHVAL